MENMNDKIGPVKTNNLHFEQGQKNPKIYDNGIVFPLQEKKR